MRGQWTANDVHNPTDGTAAHIEQALSGLSNWSCVTADRYQYMYIIFFISNTHSIFCLFLSSVRAFSRKLLCVLTNRSNKATVTTPGPVKVGIRNSRVIFSENAIKCSFFTGIRAINNYRWSTKLLNATILLISSYYIYHIQLTCPLPVTMRYQHIVADSGKIFYSALIYVYTKSILKLLSIKH